MSRNRLFYVVIVLALTILAALTIRTAVATSSIVSVGYGDYDEVERGRTNFSKVPAETSYDEVERTRAQFHPSTSADASYDEVERARARFAVNGGADASHDEVEHVRANFADAASHAMRFPGKEKDDLVGVASLAAQPAASLGAHFPGKEKDDLVGVTSLAAQPAASLGARFPGKEKDDLVGVASLAAQPAPSLGAHFPGKEKDDLVGVTSLGSVPPRVSAQATDPESVIEGFISALNAGNEDAAMAFYASEAVRTRVPSPIAGTSGVYTGKDAIQKDLETQIAGHIRIVNSNYQASGDKVTWTAKFWTDAFNKLGITPLDATGEAVVQGGKIKSHTTTLTPDSLAKIAAARAKAQAAATPAAAPATLPASGGDFGALSIPWLALLGGIALVACAGLLLKKLRRA